MVPLVLRRSPPPPPPQDRRMRGATSPLLAKTTRIQIPLHPEEKRGNPRRLKTQTQRPHTSIMAHMRRSSGSTAAVPPPPPRLPGKNSVSPSEPSPLPPPPPPPPSHPWRSRGRDRSANKRSATLAGSSLNTYIGSINNRAVARCLKHAKCEVSRRGKERKKESLGRTRRPVLTPTRD